MKTIYQFICAICVICGFTACQDRDLPGSGAMQLLSPDVAQITGTPSGDNNYDYTLTWPQSNQGATMQVAVYKNGSQIQGLTPCQGNSFTLKNLETNQLYEFLFKYANADALSKGVMTSFTRPGATAASDIKMEQIDINDDQHDLKITWTASPDATSYILKLVNNTGSRVVDATVNEPSYLLKDVQMKESWDATIIAQNDKGRALPVKASVRFLASCLNMPPQRNSLLTVTMTKPAHGCGSRLTSPKVSTFTLETSAQLPISKTTACSSGCATSRQVTLTTSGISLRLPRTQLLVSSNM